MSGHWYCSFCNDVVTMVAPARWDARRGVKCPVCHHASADWVKHDETLSPERAKMLFEQMKEAVK